MKRRTLPLLVLGVLVCLIGAPSRAAAEQRFIVRPAPLLLLSPLQTLTGVCKLLGCTIRYPLDGRLSQVYLVTRADIGDPLAFLSLLLSTVGVGDAELDATVLTAGGTATTPPPALLDTEMVPFYGTNVRRGYVEQPAASILGINAAHRNYELTGSGITVAIIDSGIDPTHQALARVVKSGYDFTRNIEGGSEMGDVDQSTVASLDQSTVASLDETGWVNQSTIACLDQSTVASLDTPKLAAFGHGTIVAGIVHRTAPEAWILPLKAFKSDGSGYLSDVLRALYYAADRNAKVVNMSFHFDDESNELKRAINYVHGKKIVTVAAAGNDGQRIVVYPAGLANVIGVASTTDADTISDFSNFGPEVAWIAAPGEGIVSTYPFGGYAAAWGTSFSAPFAAGTAALLADLDTRISTRQAGDAEGNAVWVSADIRRGRLAIPAAIEAWRRALYGR